MKFPLSLFGERKRARTDEELANDFQRTIPQAPFPQEDEPSYVQTDHLYRRVDVPFEDGLSAHHSLLASLSHRKEESRKEEGSEEAESLLDLYPSAECLRLALGTDLDMKKAAQAFEMDIHVKECSLDPSKPPTWKKYLFDPPPLETKVRYPPLELVLFGDGRYASIVPVV